MKLLVAIAAATALLSLGCTHHEHNAVELAAEADSGLYIAGTLASLGSFEWDAAPLSNHAATTLHETAVALQQKRITVEQAQKTMDAVDHAHSVILQALATCAQDSRTGKCTQDEKGARALLDVARSELETIP